MKIVKPRIVLVDNVNGEKVLRKLEKMGRICYQSQPGEEIESTERFVSSIIRRGHTSVLEHVSFTFIITTDRGVTHELVRHRISSFSQESTRYVKYDNGKMEYIEPVEMEQGSPEYSMWLQSCLNDEKIYCEMMEIGAKAQVARAVLNNSLKTQIAYTANIRSLRNFFTLRCDKAAHPHIKEIAIPMLLYMRELVPVVFDDIGYDQEFYNQYLSEGRWVDYIEDEFHDPVAISHCDRVDIGED